MAKNIDFMGAVYSDVPSVRLPQQGGGLAGFDDTTDATATAEDIAQGKTAYVNGRKVTGTGTGSTPVINPLSVTENGVYTAPSGVDGYSPVTVNVSGGGGGQEDGLIAKSLSEYTNNTVSEIGSFAFYSYIGLTSVSFGAVEMIEGSAFFSCINLASISFPALKSTNVQAFRGCYRLTEVSFPEATNIGANIFSGCSALSKVNLPKVSTINTGAFSGCYNLAEISFPTAQTISPSAFARCSALTLVEFPQVLRVTSSAFYACFSLSTAIFPMVESIGTNAFNACYNLISLNLTQVSAVPSLVASNAFNSTPIGGYSASAGQYGSIYVPASLYASFQTATNWQAFSSRMVSA